MADGSDPRVLGGAVKAGALIYSSSTTNETLVPLGANWKYLGDGSNQGTAWRTAGFSDSAWLSGPAELGYGDGDEATVVPFTDADPGTAGTQKNATTYFRKTFTVANANQITAGTIHIRYDDAAAVYVNGTEVARTAGLSADPAYNFYAAAVNNENAGPTTPSRRPSSSTAPTPSPSKSTSATPPARISASISASSSAAPASLRLTSSPAAA